MARAAQPYPLVVSLTGNTLVIDIDSHVFYEGEQMRSHRRCRCIWVMILHCLINLCVHLEYLP